MGMGTMLMPSPGVGWCEWVVKFFASISPFSARPTTTSQPEYAPAIKSIARHSPSNTCMERRGDGVQGACSTWPREPTRGQHIAPAPAALLAAHAVGLARRR